MFSKQKPSTTADTPPVEPPKADSSPSGGAGSDGATSTPADTTGGGTSIDSWADKQLKNLDKPGTDYFTTSGGYHYGPPPGEGHNVVDTKTEPTRLAAQLDGLRLAGKKIGGKLLGKGGAPGRPGETGSPDAGGYVPGHMAQAGIPPSAAPVGMHHPGAAGAAGYPHHGGYGQPMMPPGSHAGYPGYAAAAPYPQPSGYHGTPGYPMAPGYGAPGYGAPMHPHPSMAGGYPHAPVGYPHVAGGYGAPMGAAGPMRVPPGGPHHPGAGHPMAPAQAAGGAKPISPRPGASPAPDVGSGKDTTVRIDPDWEIDFEELKITKEIARGSFGVVSHALFRGSDVAVKKLIMQKLTDEQMNEFAIEVNIMKKLHHPNVLLLMGVCSRQPNLCFITEYMPGSMWSLLHEKRDIRIDFKLAMKLITDTAKGMNYMHLFKPAVLHRDLKTPNLLVDKDFNVKICDFGLARLKAHTMTGNLGTCQYMAPEVIDSKEYTESADVFAFAIIMWEILRRKPPYHGMQPMQIAFGVAKKNLRPPIPEGWHPTLVRLISDAWHVDISRRPTFTGILEVLRTIKV